MTKAQLAKRKKAADAALGSVRAEGLSPSKSIRNRLKRYSDGKISASQLKRETLTEVRSRNKAK